MLLESVIIGAIGGVVTFAGSEICKKIKPQKKENVFINNTPKEIIENEIKEEMWDDIWKYNSVKIICEDEIKMPVLLGSYYLNNGIKYLFKYPVGITTNTMSKCKDQIRELSNSDDVEFTHYKDNLAYITVTKNIEEEEKIETPKEIKDENEKWTEFWIKTKKGAGDKENGFIYPQLTNIQEWESGKIYTFSMPIGISTYNVNQVDTTLKEWLGASRIDITSPSKSTMQIKSYLKELPKLVKYQNIKREKREELEVVLGKGHTGWKRMRLLSGVHNVFIGGAVGTGKSICVNAIIADLALNYSPSELEMWLIDLKVVELIHLQKLKHVKYYGDTVEETMAMIDKLTEVMEYRYKKMKEKGVRKISAYNKLVPKNEQFPYILFCIEEIYGFTTSPLVTGNKKSGGKKKGAEEEEKENYIDKLGLLLSRCRGAGIGAMITSQRLMNAYIPRNISTHLMNRLCFAVADSKESSLLTDDKFDATKLRGKGHGCLIDTKIEEFQGFFLDEDNGEVTELLKKYNLLKA